MIFGRPGGLSFLYLLLYTDGILEAENAREEMPAGVFADKLLDTIGAWTEQGPDESMDDDLTLVVIDILN